VTQRARFIAYLAAVHLLLVGAGIALFVENPLWLFVAEAVFVASLMTGVALTRQMYRNIDFARSGVKLIRDHDFTSRLRPVGQPEVDELIAVYNRMVDSLRNERTRLQEQHHFLAHVLRVSPSGIVILDFDRRVDTLNPAAERLLGAAAAELAGRRLEELASPLADALGAMPPNTTQVRSLNAARRARCHHGTFIDRGFPRSFFLVEELTEELRQAERGAYEKLIRVMAHEVNNSVTASNSLLTSALNYRRELSSASRPDFERALGIVIERTEQLNQFMRSFAEVFRLPAPVKKPEAVVPLLERNVQLLSARPDASHVTWQWDVDSRDLLVPMDRGQMEQALLNVLQNAVDATGGQGTVAIRLRSRNGGRPTITVEDSGPGIAPEAQANLFTPFFSTKPHGQGIGLTLVGEVLSGHGFDYALEHPPGQPTRFTIVF
jgi:two-component system, NtrC family, nitrogen regulation sensor histidine kinase NtrY